VQPPKKKSRKGLIIAGILIGAVVLCGVIATGSNSNTGTKVDTTASSNAVSSSDSGHKDNTSSQQAPTPTPTPTPKPADKFNVEVKSLTVKSVGGKYRYFFDVRNHDTKLFEGSAYISLYNAKSQTSLGGEAFDTTTPIHPTYGTTVYFDINTGPPSVHGEYGITLFKYIIRIKGQQVNSGEGEINDGPV